MNKCIHCDATLTWGMFAYNQNTCWVCFAEQFRKIADQHTGTERDILVHVIKAYGEVFGVTF